jgi:vacuolar-type H+-ATPase subunit E/Vma4
MFAASGVKFTLEELLHVAAVVKAGERVADSLQAEIFTEAKIGNRDSDVLGDSGGEVAAASKGVRVDLRVGNRVRGIVVLDG